MVRKWLPGFSFLSLQLHPQSSLALLVLIISLRTLGMWTGPATSGLCPSRSNVGCP